LVRILSQTFPAPVYEDCFAVKWAENDIDAFKRQRQYWNAFKHATLPAGAPQWKKCWGLFDIVR
jgi:hypothetical protein